MTYLRILVSVVMVLEFAACELDAGQAVSPIAATTATVTTNASNYVVGEPITITWSGLPGNALDWIEYLPVGGDDHNPTRWAYTGGAASGSVTFEGAPADGSYVARAFLDDSYVKLAESAGVSVGATAIGITRTLSAITAVPEFPSSPGATLQAGRWSFIRNDSPVNYPISIDVGQIISGFTWWFTPGKNATLTATLVEVDSLTGSRSPVPNGSTSMQVFAGASFGMSVTGIEYTAREAKSYILQVSESSLFPSPPNTFVDASVTIH